MQWSNLGNQFIITFPYAVDDLSNILCFLILCYANYSVLYSLREPLITEETFPSLQYRYPTFNFKTIRKPGK